MIAPLVLLATSSLCITCIKAQTAPSVASLTSFGSGSASSGSSGSTAATATTTTTTTSPYYRAVSSTTLDLSAPSGISITSKAEAPNYSDPRWAYPSFYSGFEPGVASLEVQPIVTDPLGNYTWGLNISGPYTVPQADTFDYAYLPPSINGTLDNSSAHVIAWNANLSQFSTPASQAIVFNATQQLVTLFNATNSSNSTSTCNSCKTALGIAQQVARLVPYEIPNMAVQFCNMYQYTKAPNCSSLFAPNVEGAVVTQILYFANLSNSSYDAQWICNNQFGACPKPSVTPYYPTIDDLITTPKPTNATAPARAANSTRLKVPHISDIHLDTRYLIGAEAYCTNGLCCRERSINSKLNTTFFNASLPAARFGSFYCDTPYDLMVSALQAVPDMLGADPAFTIFTGDIVVHEPLSSIFLETQTNYVALEETVVYTLMKNYLTGANKSAPIYATISNHDNRFGNGWNAPQWLMPSYLQALYDADYDRLTALWQYEGWISSTEAQQSSTHYTAYSAKTPYGLRIIGLNGNMWYPSNIYNLINTSNADQYGMLAYTAHELQKAEDAGERVWLIMHQELGYGGGDSLPNQSDLMTQIINRYSPHVIAALFNGHTHEDQLFVFYDNNSTVMNSSTATAVSWGGQSITPGNNMFSGFKILEADSSTFEILDAYSYFTNVTANSILGAGGAPIWEFLYSSRQAYGGNISWGPDDPLNATWWHMVTEQMEINPALVETYQIYDTKASGYTKNCTSTMCRDAKVCYMRSSSNPLAGRCTPGFASEQSYMS